MAAQIVLCILQGISNELQIQLTWGIKFNKDVFVGVHYHRVKIAIIKINNVTGRFAYLCTTASFLVDKFDDIVSRTATIVAKI